MKDFHESDLARSISTAYQVQGPTEHRLAVTNDVGTYLVGRKSVRGRQAPEVEDGEQLILSGERIRPQRQT
jgi:hypothetical protein